MNYIKRTKFIFYILPLIFLLSISCKVSDSGGDPSGNPVNVGIVDIDALLFGNACTVGLLTVVTEAIPNGTEIEFNENSPFYCIIGPDATVQNGEASAGVVTDYFIGPGFVFEIPINVSFLLANGTTLDQFSTVEILGIGFSLISPVSATGIFPVVAAAADAMDPAAPSPFIFNPIGLAGKLAGLMVTVSNPALGSATFSILPDGTILVEYQTANGTVGTNILTLSLTLTTPPEIQNACPPGTISDGAIVSQSITINQTAAAPGMVAPEVCTGFMDEDGDGFVDCADQDCINAMDPACEFPEVTCDDGNDNDADTLVDCDDPDCDLNDACETGDAECTAVADEDMDGLANCLDTGCDGFDGENGDGTGDNCEFGTELTCDDQFNNDGDMQGADCLDMDCDGLDGEPGAGTTVCEVGGPETLCADGFDNDANGMTDCADQSAMSCNPVGGPALGACEDGTETLCADGIDNDGDGFVDAADLDCP